MNEDVNGNRKLFGRRRRKIKDGNGRLAQGEDEVRRILK